MGREFLSKVKGNKATFVVHSSHEFAADAAMAAMLGRGREAGPYFQLSEELIPAALASGASHSASVHLEADFKAGWTDYLRQTGLPSCGLKFKQSLTVKENTMRFLNAHNRRIPHPHPRTIHESRELSIPSKYDSDYLRLKERITSGDDLKPYLSRDILKKKQPDKNDRLLNAWGIQHFHFQRRGTRHLLFCKITESDVFAIQVLPHNEKGLWVNETLLQILHDNWPEEIAGGRLHNLPPDRAHGTDKRIELREFNANFITTAKDGTQYLAPGGGLMASGDSAEDWLNCAKIFSELKYWQEITEKSESEIRAALSWPASQPLCLKVLFDNHKFCIYEPTKATRVAFNFSTA